MRTPAGVFWTLLIILSVNFYLFTAIKSLTTHLTDKTRTVLFATYWTFIVLLIAGFLIFIFTQPDLLGRRFRMYLFAIIVSAFVAQILAGVFFLIDDIRRGFQWVVKKLFYQPELGGTGAISRSAFLTWLGTGIGSLFFGTMAYGLSNKYNYQIKRVRLHFDNLPEGFLGMKMLQFSDIHSGSFDNKKLVERGVDMIMREEADLIIFSGDIVNDQATEMNDYMDTFSRVRAPMGVYSTMGNHDYGEYVKWPINGVTKEQNIADVKAIHGKLGWKLLNNEHVILEREGDKLPLIGVENWSASLRFPRKGDLKKAHAGTEEFPFKILISHDPSHWDAEVRPVFPDIDLTLSGHTHGFQFGVKIPGIHWSPSQYIYKEWDGLYEDGNQKIYVNPGFGFLGYPGRVGILPEITVFEFV